MLIQYVFMLSIGFQATIDPEDMSSGFNKATNICDAI